VSEPLNYFNVGPTDDGVQVRFIAEALIRQASPGLPIHYTGGDKGWIGDVPTFKYSIEKIARLGWKPVMTSAQTVERAITEIHAEFLSRCNS
jgi:UDP-glucose 4-epimerase